MKLGGGRLKGSAFERKVASMVVAAFAHKGITKEDCYRTPASGGHRFAKKSDPGDLVLSPRLLKIFPYSVECKKYRGLDWPKLLSLDKDKGHWGEWWKQACAAAAVGNASVEPLLVFSQNRSEAFAIMRLTPSWKPRPVLLTRILGQRVRVVRFAELLQYLAQ